MRRKNRMETIMSGQTHSGRKGQNMSTNAVWRLMWICLAVFIVTVFFALSARAAEVGLTWDAVEPPVDGYKIYQRTEGANYDYSAPAWEGSATQCLIKGLSPATQYYFVARAYYKDLTSGDSNEVGFMPGIRPPANLKIDLEISIFIDDAGRAYSKIVSKTK